MFKLDGKVALITGGSRGIGRAIALRLAEYGADVVVNYVRHRGDAEETVAAIEKKGVRCLAVKANVAQEEDVVRMFEEIRKRHDHLDIVVSNAASGVLKPAMELTIRHWNWAMDINARALLTLTQYAVPMMRAGGRILAVSSLGAVRAVPNYTVVGASKAALESLVRHLAVELGQTPGGVKIGVVDTDNNLKALKTPDKKVHIHFPEMESWVREVTPASEEAALVNKDYPMILMAGNHMEMVANSIMRDPAWNEGRRYCTLRIHPEDAGKLGIRDKDLAVIETEAGSATVEAELTESSHTGQVVIPHGFSLVHGGKAHGVNVNRLAPAKHRDRFAATPLHRYIPCRVRKA